MSHMEICFDSLPQLVLKRFAGNEGTIIHFFPQLLIQSATRHPPSIPQLLIQSATRHPPSIPQLLIQSATRHPIERWDNGLLESTRKVSRDFL